MVRLPLFLFAMVLCAGACVGAPGRTVEDAQGIVYLPAGWDASKRAPLVVALSPGADAKGMIGLWNGVADELGWIVLASKRFRNGTDDGDMLGDVAAKVRETLARYQADSGKVILTGVSGGAMGAHYFALRFPDLAFAVVANVGKIRDDQLAQRAGNPRGRLAVFLASPGDFRYAEMKRDRRFLEGLGWKTKWIEFEGGHQPAPPAAYREAARWLSERM